ncbi:MAG: cytochrome c maturation protein CcmE, partial [Candidatus Heimdallarchaeota archaeon]|nr:cytochrome c maturation protein CcmE [Candidatus Heimdallarchaeota archaeon]
MKARHKRLSIVIGGLGVLGLLTWLALNVFESNMMLFQSPSDVVAGKAPQGKSFRLGGLVEEGTLERENDGLTVHFIVTDKVESIPVTYT